MKKWIISLGTNELWIGIGLIATIIGFIFTLITLFIATRISIKMSKKIIKKSLIVKYNKSKKSIKAKIEGYQLRLSDDNTLRDFEILNAVSLLNEYAILFNYIERYQIFKIKKHLKKQSINKEILIKQMSEIIALIEKTKEDNIID